MNFVEWLKYHFLIWLIPGPQGKIADADFVCPQAFGRNTWTDKEISGAMAKLFRGIDSSKEQDQAMDRLAKINFDPGIVNISLAKGCYHLARRLKENGKNPWIIGQWEVIFALATADEEMASWYKENREFIVAIWPPLSGEYLNTRGMLFIAKEIARKHRLRYPIVVAHREHLARCVLLAEMIFGKANVALLPTLLPECQPFFDPNSVHPQTTAKWTWRWYEFRARWHHFLKGWAP